MRPMPNGSGPRLRRLLHLVGRRLPRANGEMTVAGIGAPIEIARDRWGIPHIRAQSDADAWFGLGFCHGQDRGFQLELLLRAGRGTLAAILGRAALPIDRLSRTLGFRRVADRQRALLDAHVAEALAAYVAGINAASAVTPRPHELVLLRASRTDWEIEDVLAFMGIQSLALSGNWDVELARVRILTGDGADALRAVDPAYGEWLPVVSPVGSPFGTAPWRVAADAELLRSVIGMGGASNAWAVAPSRTRSGAPILANDPHLGPNLPAPWYLAHVRTPAWSIAGASFVGGPVFPSGHNGTAAWGITAACTDSSDLFVEDVDLDAGTVRGRNGPEPIVTLRETIEVRGGPPVVEEVRLTPRGPIITPLLEGIDLPLSLSATWLQPARVRGLLDAQHATTFEAFRAAFADWPGPALNVVYADADGHIGWQLTGALPSRAGGDGTLPRPAWEGAWNADHLPFEALPHLADPPEAFVASANNAARADVTGEVILGADWLDGYRAARLLEALGSRDDWEVASTSRLQIDVRSVPWADIRDLVLAAPPPDAAARLALATLAGWDGEVSAGSVAASVYELLMAELAVEQARAAAPDTWPWAIGAGLGDAVPGTTFGARTVSHVVRRLRDGTLASAIGPALSRAIRLLQERFGPDPHAWAWGRARPLVLRHPLGARRPLDRLLNVGPVAVGGDANTVAQAGVRPIDPTANPAAIANHRMVVDLGDVERSRFVLAGGQSGNPLSPHYADLLELWLRGDGVPIAWAPERVEATLVDRLALRPSNGRETQRRAEAS